MKKLFFLILTTLMFTSCEAIFEAATGAERASIGNAYEVLVVCDDNIWESELGVALQKTLRSGIPGLPQHEDAFKVTRVSNNDFTGVKPRFRNIIHVKIDNNTYTAPAFRYKKDVDAVSQLVMTIQAPTIESGAEYVTENMQTIIDFLNDGEKERRLKIIKESYNSNANNLAEEMFGCSFKIPMDIQGTKTGKDFIWLSDMNSTNPDILNFAMYSYPYEGPESFTKENFIHMRDSMMKANIQGGGNNEYVETAKNSVTVEDSGYNDRYVQIARGLWNMKNALEPWGGPFVSHSVVDEINQRVIVVEAFMFSSKRMGDTMRQLEASLYTLELPYDKLMKQIESPEGVTIDGSKETTSN